MASKVLVAYGGATSITITAGTLGNGSARGCAAVDNSVNLYLDANLRFTAAIPNTALGSDKLINIYAVGSDDGTNWPGTSTASDDDYVGTDAAVGLQSPSIYRAPSIWVVPNNNLTTRFFVPSICALLGCRFLPTKWGLVVENRTGQAFNSGFTAEYNGLYLTVG